MDHYSLQFISDIPYDPSDSDSIDMSNRILRHPNEGVYIYSFEKGKMIYADGWREVNGYSNTEISMVKIVMLTAPDFADFVHEINDKALMFLHQRRVRLNEYFFNIEIEMLHKNGHTVPISATVSVHDTLDNGQLKSIMGRFLVDRSIRFGQVRKFSAYGPDKDIFEQSLNDNLIFKCRISDKELEVIRLLSRGFTYKEIGEKLLIYTSAVEKRIRPLFERFKVQNNAHLVAFAYENYLLP